MGGDITLRQALLWRRFILLVVAIDLVVMAALIIQKAATRPPWLETSELFGGLAASPIAITLLAALGVAAVLAFARWPTRPGWGWTAVGLEVLLNQAFGMVHGTFSAAFVFGGGCLFGWLAGDLYARLLGYQRDGSPIDRLATARLSAMGVLAILSAAYFMTFVAKVAVEGAGWAQADHLRLIVISELQVDGSWAEPFRRLIADSAPVAAALGWFTLAVEALAPLMLIGPRIRAVMCTLLISFHMGVAVVLQFIFVQAILLDLLFALPLGIWAREQLTHEEPERPVSRQLVLAAGVLLLAVAVLWLAPFEPRPLPVDSYPRPTG